MDQIYLDIILMSGQLGIKVKQLISAVSVRRLDSPYGPIYTSIYCINQIICKII